MSEKMPAIFIGHGSPMNLIYDNPFTRSLAEVAGQFPRPETVVVLSAHWVTKGLFVTCDQKPRQIYDFYGFPDTLYLEKYHPHGSPETAVKITGRIKSSKVECSLDWGLDHGSWAILKHMYPKADIPVLQISLDAARSGEELVSLGKELSDMREEGILFIGSGNIVHNLWMADFDDQNAQPPDWAEEFDKGVKELIVSRNIQKLADYKSIVKNSKLPVPTNEHYLPMLFIMGMTAENEDAVFFHEGFQHGTISMRCFRTG